MEGYAQLCISACTGNALISADPCGPSLSTNRTAYLEAYWSPAAPAPCPLAGPDPCASATFTHSSRMRGKQGLGRGPVRGPGRRIIPAPRVASVRWPVLSVQPAHVQPRRVPLVMRWPSAHDRRAVRARVSRGRPRVPCRRCACAPPRGGSGVFCGPGGEERLDGGEMLCVGGQHKVAAAIDVQLAARPDLWRTWASRSWRCYAQ